MKVDLEKYKNKRICVALSGGKDSVCLLHYLLKNGGGFGIKISAVNCDHGMRGEESERDSAFVKSLCEELGVKLHFFKSHQKLSGEEQARNWRYGCFKAVLDCGGADFIATAHHMGDNAETVLFNLVRGSGLKGVCGITDDFAAGIIRPLVSVSPREIERYIAENNLSFVTDNTNFSRDYSRNKIRLDVLPALETCAVGATEAIYRFSRIAAEDEEYLSRVASELVVKRGGFGYLIKSCGERALFCRAARIAVADGFGKKDYTGAHIENLFSLQSAAAGKMFEFLNLKAVRERGGVAIYSPESARECDFNQLVDGGVFDFYGLPLAVCKEDGSDAVYENVREKYGSLPLKKLTFDFDKIPAGARVRTYAPLDLFKRFKGGEKTVGDYFTDVKMPQGVRRFIPLICTGGRVLAVCGEEISDEIKIDGATNAKYCIISAEYGLI